MANNARLSKLIQGYLESYPGFRSLTLAKLVNSENPEIAVEAARGAIRYYRGAAGNEKRERVDRNYANKYMAEGFTPPMDDNVEYTPFIIKEKNVLILSDLHVPFHDPEAISAAIAWGIRKPIDAILLNGDIMDVYCWSKFQKDPAVWFRGMQPEFDKTKYLLDELNISFPSAKIYYKMGNHEERISRLKWEDPRFHGLRALDIESLLSVNEFNCTIVKDRRIVKIGNLNVLHGHELQASSPVNPARGVYNATKASVMIGHLHRTSEHTEPGLDDYVTTWSIGCMCYLHPPYAVINKWNHGFGYARVNGDTFRASTLRIYNGVVL